MMMICVQDSTCSQMADAAARTAPRSKFVRQQSPLDDKQNIFTWRQYLSHPHHLHLLKGQTIFGAYCRPVSTRIEVLTEERGNYGRQKINKKIGAECDDDGYPPTLKSKSKTVATVPLQTYASQTQEETVNLSLTRPKQSLQYQDLLLVILTAVNLTCLHNASSCAGFSNSELYDNLSPVGNNYPIQSYTRPPTPVTITPLTRRRRFFYDDTLIGSMSTDAGSFSQDPSSTIEPPGFVQSSWTSILNPLGLLGGGQRPQQPNTGGGGDILDNHIKKILVPRVSGTPGNVEVRQYIVDELKKNNYHVELDEFTGSTPVGKVNFANIIASSNPNACRQLVLACHYDSKMMDGFLGAIDSAVPCAMLLKMSSTFSTSFRPSNDDNSSNNIGLQFIFFDGEEAYVQWSQTDSLYGSRHLAAKWSKQSAPTQCGSGKSELDKIELFVLLDLIGTSDTSFVMYNNRLKHHYEALQRYEKAHLTRDGLNQLQTRRTAAFKSRTMPLDFVEDDHVPFKKRGVPILLLLAHPFPRVWHTVADNYDAIDFPKTRRILHVLEEFVSNYPNGAKNSSN